MKKSIMAKILAIIFVTGFVFLLMSFCDNIQYAIATEIPGVRNKDAYIRHSGNSWIFGTSSVERIVTLEGGKFLLKRFRDKVSGRELAAGSNEFAVTIGDVPGRVSGSSGGWKLVDYRETKLRQGELQLDITLRRDFLQVTKRYVIYPGSSIIREWVSIKNMGTSPLKIKEPGILDIGVSMGDPESLDLHWMSGSESIPGSWNLKTERLGPGTARRFDSYEPFAVPAGTLQPDGVEARILLNDSQVWPAQVWQHVANGYMHAPFDTILSVRSGDRIAFVVNMHRNSIGDNTTFDPTISFEGSEAHTASREFGDKQGMNGWSYQYIENGKFVDLVYSPVEKKWHKAQSNTTGACSIGESSQHPDSAQDVARVWTASSNGKVRVTGEVTNSGNFRQGLLLVILAGILSCGLGLAFVYGQGPIIEAVKQQGVGEITANFTVWALACVGGALVNILYAVFWMTKKKTWNLLFIRKDEFICGALFGAQFLVSVILMGRGMVLLGILGASVGYGIQQSMQVIGNQVVGFVGGEWLGVKGKLRKTMYLALGIIFLAVIILAYSNTVV